MSIRNLASGTRAAIADALQDAKRKLLGKLPNPNAQRTTANTCLTSDTLVEVGVKLIILARQLKDLAARNDFELAHSFLRLGSNLCPSLFGRFRNLRSASRRQYPLLDAR